MRKKRIYICLIMVLFFMVIGYSALNTNIFATGDIILTNNLDDFKVYIKNIFIDGNDYSNNIENGESFTVSNINELKKIKYSIMNESYEYDTKVEMKCSSITTNEEITFDIGTIEAQMSKEDEIQLDAGKCSYENGYTWDFDFTGETQEFIAPCKGTYRLETWGAQGGTHNYEDVDYWVGGYGGYSNGNILLNQNTSLYIAVGGQGYATNGYNGGGKSARKLGSGGGATSIQNVLINDGQLFNYYNNQSNVLIVSGGGGGNDATKTGVNGHAGGFIGNNGGQGNNSFDIVSYAQGGTQNSAGASDSSSSYIEPASFGKGASDNSEDSGGSGGGGWYGGGATANWGLGAGGSGYIGNDSLQNKAMYCYDCEESKEVSTKTISTTGEDADKTNCPNGYSSSPMSKCAKAGNGYARIILLNSEPITSSYTCTIEVTEIERNTKSKEYCSKLIGKTWDFEYNGTDGTDGSIQNFITPCNGTYKLETWGAQGGDDVYGGYGGYSNGNILINKEEMLYIGIGGQGIEADPGTTSGGGYNGGGDADRLPLSISASIRYGGGGATHIAFSSGELYLLETIQTELLMVSAGGGGGKNNEDEETRYGGNAGGYIGLSAVNGKTNGTIASGGGGTQTSGGTGGISTMYGVASSGTFGQGGNGNSHASGGGGGFYGGGGGTRDNIDGTGGGGSSYIGNESLKNKAMYCYDCEESKEVSTKTVSTTGEDADKTNCPNGYSSSPISNCAKQGHGYARITLLNLN